ncbi:MAG: 30S ribosomal protein S1 [Polyangiaceae bacterium]|nr:30S ribosomal protein S1 [Polyangiaceae bacterium]MCB9608673.1 30S ribosomal protein S1 [Polyangiaceae bacterium]
MASEESNQEQEQQPSAGAPDASNAAASADAGQTEDTSTATAATAAEAAAPAPEAAAPAPEATPEAAAAATETSATETAGTEAAADGGAEAAEASSAEHSSPGASAEGAEGDKKKRRRRRKKKKKPEGAEATQRPATDRAPFHMGEEVFGKVTAVLETAIMIDLSGKALAIFDRSEMETDDLVPEVGDRFVARVHNDGSRGGLVVLTRKPLREEEVKPSLEIAAKEGTLVKGLITGVIKGGVEVSLGGLRAFAPASGMDLHPTRANFVGLVGQVLEFKIVQFEKGGRDVVVTRRPMLEQEAHERRKKALETLTEGQVMKGVVRTVVEWGAFVALPEAENLEGLVHISEASHDPRARMEDLLKAGEEVEVQITKIDDKGKIWLSRKALISDPWAEAKEKFPPGSKHTGKVTKLTDFGAFIELSDGVEGLMHVADLSLTRVSHPNEVLSEGQEIEVVIHNFDRRHKKLGLHPAPSADQADEQPQKIVKGAKLDVEVVKAESAGLVVRVLGVTGRAARGFVPAGHTGTERGTDLRKAFPAKSKIRTKVIDLDPRRGEPKLSIRALSEDEERQAHRDYRKKVAAESKFGTLGDLLQKALNQK